MSTPTTQQEATAPQPIDFDSDEPLPICPLRPEGGEPCEACQ